MSPEQYNRQLKQLRDARIAGKIDAPTYVRLLADLGPPPNDSPASTHHDQGTPSTAATIAQSTWSLSKAGFSGLAGTATGAIVGFRVGCVTVLFCGIVLGGICRFLPVLQPVAIVVAILIAIGATLVSVATAVDEARDQSKQKALRIVAGICAAVVTVFLCGMMVVTISDHDFYADNEEQIAEDNARREKEALEKELLQRVLLTQSTFNSHMVRGGVVRTLNYEMTPTSLGSPPMSS